MKKDNDKVENVEKKEATDQQQDQSEQDQEAQGASTIKGMNIDLAKLREIMVWDKYKGQTEEEVFIRNGKNINDLPKHQEIIDIVHAGGLQKWAETLRVSSQKELYGRLMTAIRRTIAEPVFNNKKTVDAFPPLDNFFY